VERRTKIVATIGPASDSLETMRAMIAAGMNMARVSLAHATVEETQERIDRLRTAADAEGQVVGVLADLPGPKIRAAEFPEGGVHLPEGATLELVPAATADASSDERRVAVQHPSLLEELRSGDRVALGDGAIELLVDTVDRQRAVAEVLTGGWAQGRPGVVLPAGRTTFASPTADDLTMLAAIAGSVDAVAVSFVRTAADLERARAATPSPGPALVAKIETPEAVESVEAIIAASDGVMVARGDLGIRCALEDVPHHQKHIIRTGVAYGRPVITATQMLESMVRAPTPTRAEVSDIANAVFDGSSALMLSGETAIGHDPVNAVRTMARVAQRAEREFNYVAWGQGLGRQQSVEGAATTGHDRITASISAAGWRAAMDTDVAAIIACTNSGATARAISRFRPTAPILGVTPSPVTARQLSVAWGITPILADRHGTTDEIVWFAVQAAVERSVVTSGDIVAVLVGSPTDPDPTTDTLRLVRVR
jgi:pyruvate kinase